MVYPSKSVYFSVKSRDKTVFLELLTYLFFQIHSLATAHSGAGKVKVALTAIVANHLVVNLTLAVEGAIKAASRVRNTETERPVLLGSDGSGKLLGYGHMAL
ncbi:Hypothetical predicted protein [Prunus dulcis]|uniref:Uncharacterized protein n=1 Tax=Prunus dulcis TaxID=3755 RepID=A0A5E4FHI7_PRUDU|nr:Hypothetical predicted protein [Prunus dulcis]